VFRYDRAEQALALEKWEAANVFPVHRQHVERDEMERTAAAHEIVELWPARLVVVPPVT
jgi:hypothetical protein